MSKQLRDLIREVLKEGLLESDADGDGTPNWKEMELMAADERRKWLQTASDEERRRWIHSASDEELKSVYHPEDTLADAIYHAIGPVLEASGPWGSEATAGIVQQVESRVRETMISAGGQERRMIRQIMRMNPESSQLKPFHDMARQVIEEIQPEEEPQGLAGSSYEDTLSAYKSNPEWFNENRQERRQRREDRRQERARRKLQELLDALDEIAEDDILLELRSIMALYEYEPHPAGRGSMRAAPETDVSASSEDK